MYKNTFIYKEKFGFEAGGEIEELRVAYHSSSEKYEGQDLGVGLEELFSKLSKEGGNHLIDATYKGKILLRDLPGGPEEGSLK